MPCRDAWLRTLPWPWSGGLYKRSCWQAARSNQKGHPAIVAISLECIIQVGLNLLGQVAASRVIELLPTTAHAMLAP